jgi:hypothetical protein
MKLSIPLPFRPNGGWKSLYSECALQACQNTLLMRSVHSSIGIRVGESWYCSMNCFATAAHQRFASLIGEGVIEMPHRPRLSIGLAMCAKGHLTDEQLRLAIIESQLRGEDMEAALIRLRMATEWQLASARSAQWGYPVLRQDRTGQPMEVDIPPSFLRACSAVPLQHSVPAKRLVLGFVYRVDHSLLSSLEQITGLRVEPCFITPTEYRQQSERITAAPDCEEVIFEDSQTNTQMAKNVAGFAIEVGARDARFARCRDYIWTRLIGKRRRIDVLFRIAHATANEGTELPRFQVRSGAR